MPGINPIESVVDSASSATSASLSPAGPGPRGTGAAPSLAHRPRQQAQGGPSSSPQDTFVRPPSAPLAQVGRPGGAVGNGNPGPGGPSGPGGSGAGASPEAPSAPLAQARPSGGNGSGGGTGPGEKPGDGEGPSRPSGDAPWSAPTAPAGAGPARPIPTGPTPQNPGNQGPGNPGPGNDGPGNQGPAGARPAPSAPTGSGPGGPGSGPQGASPQQRPPVQTPLPQPPPFQPPSSSGPGRPFVPGGSADRPAERPASGFSPLFSTGDPNAGPRRAARDEAPPSRLDLQNAADQLRGEADARARADRLNGQLQGFGENLARAAAFLRELGSGELARTVDGLISRADVSPRDVERALRLLGDAARSLDPGSLRALLQGSGSLKQVLVLGLLLGQRGLLPRAGLDLQTFTALAAALGRLGQAVGGKDAAVSALLQGLIVDAGAPAANGSLAGVDLAGADLAAFLALQSGSTALRQDTALHLLAAYRMAGEGAPVVARALAGLLAALAEGRAGLAVLLELDAGTRRGVIEDALRGAGMLAVPVEHALARDLRKGVLRFIDKVAHLRPDEYGRGREAANKLRVEAFVAGVELMDSPPWRDDERLKRTLASMFSAYGDAIVEELSDPFSSSSDRAGSHLIRFFERVLLNPRRPSSQSLALEGLVRYLGVAGFRPLRGALAPSEVDPRLARNRGAVAERGLDYALRALRSAARRGLSAIEDPAARERLVVQVFGALLGDWLVLDPVIGRTVLELRQGKDEIMGEVYAWLARTYLGDEAADDVQALVEAILDDPMAAARGEALPGVGIPAELPPLIRAGR